MPLSLTGVILVVDDDDSMRQAIQRLLNAAGFKTEAYASAEALLADGRAAFAACLVSDYKLPGMSGLDLLSELRTRGFKPPTIVVTAHDSIDLREEAMRRGATGYLAKPFRSADLLDAIERAVKGRPPP
ncbi:response regulator [Variovorax sp. J22P168]|uniref:response regulator transcription factor n=1 Tax=Variovorax jilinensis TaxID=3053513 RepID=UPI0025780126|nr:response regulator [Variovorax sp. J22P168]MDM0011671.1 response regulator [Variovorax sp. J22P168]